MDGKQRNFTSKIYFAGRCHRRDADHCAPPRSRARLRAAQRHAQHRRHRRRRHGRANLINLASQNIVALCDVDWAMRANHWTVSTQTSRGCAARIDAPPAEPVPGQPSAEFNREKAKSQLADMIKLKTEHVRKPSATKTIARCWSSRKTSTPSSWPLPDHMHATIALAAMDLGKHVYVQKPLAWSVDECRALARRAKERKSPTQMGQSGIALDQARTADRPSQRLLHVHMLAEIHGGQRDRGMHVIGSGHDDGVDVFLLLQLWR